MEGAMSDARVEAARGALQAAAEEVETVRRRLQAIHDSLPVTRQEKDLRDLDRDPEPATEMRAVIRNVLNDSLKPAAEDLRAAAAYRRGGAAPVLDLTVESEAVQRLLYDLVVKDNFTAKPLADPGDVWTPAYTPEQAGLEVFFERGRWFAVWRKLEVPEGAPEAERWEVLRLEENPDKPGSIVYLEV
jgi:hypothetical protein